MKKDQQNKKAVIVSVISDLVTDQRVHKVCLFLHEKNLEVLLIGRSFSDSGKLESRVYQTRRLACVFRKGPLQYIEFNLRLLFVLLFGRAGLLVSNDLDTLAPNYLVSRLRKIPLVYDAHEYFTGVPELMHRPNKRKIWKWLEARILPRLTSAYTVNESIRDLYKKEYGIHMEVVRNLPNLQVKSPSDKETIPFRLILQGAGMNRDRGIEETILALKILPPSFSLVLVGGGTIWNALHALVEKEKLGDRVQFISKLPFNELRDLTRTAWLGISMDKPVSLNNTFSLPNKLFDYIHSGVPVLASALPEVKKIIEQYGAGVCIDQVTPESIARSVLEIAGNEQRYQWFKRNCTVAARELNWQQETVILEKIYTPFYT